MHEFQRVAIVNRGEPAMRLIHAVREFNGEFGTPIRTIALYTEPDQSAMFVREADEAVSLGAAFSLDANGQRKHSYLNHQLLEQALAAARADAVWVGWGFVAEQADFADLCARSGIVFIGPGGDVMRRLGDKISSKLMAEQAQVPVAPWSGAAVETLADAYRHAAQLGYPLMIKATAGGGGRGIRKVTREEELTNAFESARSEALTAFGDATVFMESMVANARHIEVQLIGDHYGTVWAVGVRDCSLQRRHQKVIEESASTALTLEQEQMLRNAAVRLGQAVGYHNAGTVEFLYDPAGGTFSFMEVNARLQVEHPVTEVTTGLDLVKLQLHVARGGRLIGPPPLTTGHAIEARLNAEDADNNFAPAPGLIELFQMPAGPGLRVDTGVSTGDQIAPQYDSMIAKIIAYGRSRDEARARLIRALTQCKIVVRGGTTNKAFLLELLNNGAVASGDIHNNWLDEMMATGRRARPRYSDIALLQAAINAYEDELAVEEAQFYATAGRGRPVVREEVGRVIELSYRHQRYHLTVYRVAPQEYRIDAEGRRVLVAIERQGRFERLLKILSGPNRASQPFHILSIVDGVTHQIEVDGFAHTVLHDEAGFLRSPSPAIVVAINVKEGDKVAAGAPLAILEVMKMEMTLTAPFAGCVRQLLVAANVQVGAGTPIIRLDAHSQDQGKRESERIGFENIDELIPPAGHDSALDAYRQNLTGLRRMMLGFEIDAAESKRMLAARARLARALATGDEEMGRREDELIKIYVDLNALFRRRAVSEDIDTDGMEADEVLVSDKYLISYMRAFDAHAAGVPAEFFLKLRQALAHYGIDSLARSPALAEAMLWIYKARRRADEQAAVAFSVLEQRLEEYKEGRGGHGHQNSHFARLLDAVITISEHRAIALNDLARELRYRYFEEPIFAQARQEVYAGAEASLNYLAANANAPDRGRHIDALVSCPQPLVSVLLPRLPVADLHMRLTMLEVLTRRYYRIRPLAGLSAQVFENHGFARAEYDYEDRHVHIVTTYAELTRLAETVNIVNRYIVRFARAHDVALDLYVLRVGRMAEADELEREIHAIINGAGFLRPLRRIVVAVSCTECGYGMGAMQHFTYRPHQDAQGTIVYEEEKLYRNLHPMMGKRMHLWRLKNFQIERLPSAEDIYLFHARAHSNAKDERLFAIAEVRDLTPVRDEAGRIAQLPHLERMAMEALADIRLWQYRRTPAERLHWNRLLLYIWPVLELNVEELERVIARILPATEGLGLEQIAMRARALDGRTIRDTVIRIYNPGSGGLIVKYTPVPDYPLAPLAPYEQKVVRLRQRGLIYPYELIKVLTPPADAHAEFPHGDFVEYDLDANNNLAPVARPYGENSANIIAGVIRNYTGKYPEGMVRVVLLGDPSKEMGSLAEPECRRIIGAIELAARMQVPIEWFAVSAGAKISMESGTENMDWIAQALRHMVEFTQAGGEINVVVNGINVGAQPYWNAEATMLMHTRGILIMTNEGAMVLTGKQALDYSGSVSAEDNFGIGGYERTMGPNGQAQYFARDMNEACHILLRHYEHTYIMPGERCPRRANTADLRERDVRAYAHGSEGFATVGEIFSDETNAGRKRPFEIRRVMRAVSDQDQQPLERWASMRDADTAVVWDAHIGGYPVCLLGFESRPIARTGFIPADGPAQWTSGTLFPQASKKIARAINAASNNRPVVVLANLTGFDGSPESMRKIQLEYGAEIGRAVVNFKGPIVFCVISRYHGGAFVVFSRRLHDNMEVTALEGAYASVIGGTPAAAVVFAREVDERTRKDARIQALEQQLCAAGDEEKRRLRAKLNELHKAVRSEKLGEVADEFDRVHSVHRALKVGSLTNIIPPGELRPYIIDAIERSIKNFTTETQRARRAEGD